MKRLVVSLSALLCGILCGCSTTVYVPQLPDAPGTLTTRCQELRHIPENAMTKDAVKVIVENYSLYHECSDRVDSWIEWYSAQKKTIGNTKIR